MAFSIREETQKPEKRFLPATVMTSELGREGYQVKHNRYVSFSDWTVEKNGAPLGRAFRSYRPFGTLEFVFYQNSTDSNLEKIVRKYAGKLHFHIEN